MSLLHVNKEAPALVGPSGPTPSGDLPLSVLDRCPWMRLAVQMIMVFDHGFESAQVIREALAKTLVAYYPVAGRIAGISDGELGVCCTGKGVWFVEASSDCRLEDVDYLSRVPFDFPKEELLPSPPQEIDEIALPFMMQVTQFKCGGFVVGVKFNHAIFDGVGAGQFITAIGDMARGLDEPTVKPVWCRDILRHPVPSIPADDHIGARPIEIQEPGVKLRLCAIDIPMDCIDRQNDGFADATGQKCTAFDVVAAKLWQSRTRAINLPRDADVSFLFVASTRHLHEELPRGYYGNCIFPGIAEALSERIASATLFDVVAMVKEAKQSLPTKFWRSLMGQDLPRPKPPSYGNMAVFDWRRLGFYEADYGWGGARHVVRLNEHDGIAGAARIIRSPLLKMGIRVMTHCVAEEHYEAFLKEMNDWP